MVTTSEITKPAMSAEETTELSSFSRLAPYALATRIAALAPRAPSVKVGIRLRLLTKPTDATATAPSAPTTIWLMKLSNRIKTNSRLTGIAILAISRPGVAVAGVDITSQAYSRQIYI
jgi:hypothetical protein